MMIQKLLRRSQRHLYGNGLPIVQTIRFSSSSASSSSSSSSRGGEASRRLYRILRHQCKGLQKTFPSHPSGGETMMLLQPPLHPSQSGTHRILSIVSASPAEVDEQKDDIRNLLVYFRDYQEDNNEETDSYDWFATIQQSLQQSTTSSNNKGDDRQSSSTTTIPLDWDYTDEPTIWTTTSSIERAIRHAFKNSQGSEEDRSLMNKYAIRAHQFLTQQAEMHRSSSVSFDNDVRVVATSKYTGSTYPGPMMRSGQPRNQFNYRIRIENLSDQVTVKLLGRSWLIEDLGEGVPQDDKILTVDAPTSGAVGQLPVLRPGEAFEYMSSCQLISSVGEMGGRFHFAIVPMNTPSDTVRNNTEYAESDKFEVEVNPFPLEAPVA